MRPLFFQREIPFKIQQWITDIKHPTTTTKIITLAYAAYPNTHRLKHTHTDTQAHMGKEGRTETSKLQTKT